MQQSVYINQQNEYINQQNEYKTQNVYIKANKVNINEIEKASPKKWFEFLLSYQKNSITKKLLKLSKNKWRNLKKNIYICKTLIMLLNNAIEIKLG